MSENPTWIFPTVQKTAYCAKLPAGRGGGKVGGVGGDDPTLAALGRVLPGVRLLSSDLQVPGSPDPAAGQSSVVAFPSVSSC